MTPELRDGVLAKVRAGWARPMPDAMLGLFAEKLTPLDAERAMKAVDVLIDTKSHRPAWSDFKEAYDAARGGSTERPAPRPVCGMCDDGWVDVTPEADKAGAIGTVMACPNGCRPMTHEERQEHNYRTDRSFVRAQPDLVDAAARVAAARSFYEPDRDDEPF